MSSSPRRPASAPAPVAPPARKRTANAPHEVRIIGGTWKRTKLPVPDLPGLRPTPDRVRETLFNWLGQDLTGWHCVDAFAGTGALGLEAASRGAGHVLLVEQEGSLVDALRALTRRLGAHSVRIERGNAITALQRLAPGSQDLVLLDPPFEANLYDKALAAAATALKPDGWLYLEASSAWSGEALAAHGLARERYLKAGAVHAHLLRRAAVGSGS